jgi:hypothetical protein
MKKKTSSLLPRLPTPMPRTILNLDVAVPATSMDRDIGKGLTAPLLTRGLELVGKLMLLPRIELEDNMVLSMDVDGDTMRGLLL